MVAIAFVVHGNLKINSKFNLAFDRLLSTWKRIYTKITLLKQ